MLLKLISGIFGMGSGATLANNVGGVVTHITMLPLIYYLLDHASETVNMNVSLGFLGVVVAFGYLLIELTRRGTSSGIGGVP